MLCIPACIQIRTSTGAWRVSAHRVLAQLTFIRLSVPSPSSRATQHDVAWFQSGAGQHAPSLSWATATTLPITNGLDRERVRSSLANPGFDAAGRAPSSTIPTLLLKLHERRPLRAGRKRIVNHNAPFHTREAYFFFPNHGNGHIYIIRICSKD
jgi:hypothetical protein